jgi:tagaturonate reductase
MNLRRALDRSLITSAAPDAGPVELPPASLLELPERAVQFGTGAFLRGFVEFFIDSANRAGSFDGRIVAVGSTGSGRDDVVNDQQGLYTLVTEGIENGRPVREFRLISSLSRALSANAEWGEVLQLARNPEIALVFSNTTEVGIVLDPDDELADPPRSFPGKLTAFLYERARTFGYSAESGLDIVPCELVERNGDKLRTIVEELGTRWNLGDSFHRWLNANVVFCNTLVDRIVPGVPSPERRSEMEQILGYRDALITVCEPYRLFAIECPANCRAALRFADADPGIILTGDIEPYRLRKVRLLNGAHSLLAPVALQCGAATVSEAMSDELVGAYLRRTMYDELVAALDAPQAVTFAREVVERFSNPYLAHSLFDITLHGTAKMKVRVIPSIVDFAAKERRVPELIAFGFAAFLLFLRGDLQALRRSQGLPVPADEQGAHVREFWTRDGPDRSPRSVAREACANESLWGASLASIPGFEDAVAMHLARMEDIGVRAALSQLLFRGAHRPEPADERIPR